MDTFVNHAANGAKYGSQNPRQKLLSESLINNLIVNCSLPVSLVDNPNLCKFLADMDPKFTPPCRQTVTTSIIPQLVQKKRTNLKGLISSVSDVALTTDEWTDRRMHAFPGVTVHVYNVKSGKSTSHLLAFRAFPGTHSGQRIAEELGAVIDEFELRTKLRYIVSDNASAMKRAMHILLDVPESDDQNSLDDYLDDESLWQDFDDDSDDHVEEEHAILLCARRLPCFAHSIQLVTRDGLKTVGLLKKALAKCSKLTSLVHQSSLFRSSFEKVFGSGRSIPVANDTRWNSTLRQLKAIIELDQVKLTKLLKETTQDQLILPAKELQVQELVDSLEPFAEATDLTQGDKTMTVSCVLPGVLSLWKMLEEKLELPGIFSNYVRFIVNKIKIIGVCILIHLPYKFSVPLWHMHVCCISLSMSLNFFITLKKLIITSS